MDKFLFFLKEIADNASNKFPQSKKLYDKESLNKENKEQINIFEQSENIKNFNSKDINQEDYVYNPFKNCYAKLRKFSSLPTNCFSGTFIKLLAPVLSIVKILS